MRAVVSVATSPHYWANLDRLLASPNIVTSENTIPICWKESLPSGSPTHNEQPYAFKIFAIEEAARQGAISILWFDSSVVVLKDLDPIWELIESQGYWFSRNYGWNNGQFCSDEALEIMGGMTRAEAFKTPQCVASCFGLDMRSKFAQGFLAAWKMFAEMGAFKGDRGNLTGHVADPTAYQGHRNDQSVASQIIADFKMKMTDPPEYFAEQGYPQSEATILTLER